MYWIKPEEKLPDDFKRVLVVYDQHLNYKDTIKNITIAYHYQNNWSNDDKKIIEKVYYWMPLPEIKEE